LRGDKMMKTFEDKNPKEVLYTGELLGYTGRRNPFSQEVYAIVNIDGNIRRTPIYCRQMKYIQKEYYPSRSIIDIGTWRIISQHVTKDFKHHAEEAFFDYKIS
jgi:hypothetical protein